MADNMGGGHDKSQATALALNSIQLRLQSAEVRLQDQNTHIDQLSRDNAMLKGAEQARRDDRESSSRWMQPLVNIGTIMIVGAVSTIFYQGIESNASGLSELNLTYTERITRKDLRLENLEDWVRSDEKRTVRERDEFETLENVIHHNTVVITTQGQEVDSVDGRAQLTHDQLVALKVLSDARQDQLQGDLSSIVSYFNQHAAHVDRVLQIMYGRAFPGEELPEMEYYTERSSSGRGGE